MFVNLGFLSLFASQVLFDVKHGVGTITLNRLVLWKCVVLFVWATAWDESMNH